MMHMYTIIISLDEIYNYMYNPIRLVYYSRRYFHWPTMQLNEVGNLPTVFLMCNLVLQIQFILII